MNVGVPGLWIPVGGLDHVHDPDAGGVHPGKLQRRLEHGFGHLAVVDRGKDTLAHGSLQN